MLKVFLVEDECVVREGIKKNIDWKANGYEFCGEASDGELAYPLIQKLQPDIVITDIKMPFMDGLELSRLIKLEFPKIEIIILSGYEEFEYAKEAIKIGVAQYLSKPINGDELLKEVKNVAEKIEEQQRELEIKEKYRKEMEEMYLLERKNYFQYLVNSEKTVPELLKMAGKLHIDITASWYNIALLKYQITGQAPDEYSKFMIEIDQEIDNVTESQTDILLFDRNSEGKAILFKAYSQESLQDLQNEYLNTLRQVLEKYENIRYFIGIGLSVNRIGELPQTYEKASHAFAHRYLMSENCIMDSTELDQMTNYANDDFDISNIDPKQMNRKRIQEFLRLGDKEEIRYFIDEFMMNLGKDAINSFMFRQYIAMDVYFAVAEFIEELQMSKDLIPVFDLQKDTLQTVESTKNYVITITEKALELREKSASNRYGAVVEEVVKYIEKYYAKEELSLNLVASHVNFSPNHLSMVFGQQTGHTFMKYLTDYRMNIAKNLLRCTGKRSSEISLEVGYKDPHYFSYLFKKTQGVTPTQYRSGNR